MNRFSPTADTRDATAAIAGVAWLACLAGCGGGGGERLFDDVVLTPVREELVELEIGSFIVPVPMVLENVTTRFEPENLMQIEFDLFAVVEPSEAKRVARLLERNEGRIRDGVIRVCRNTTRDDLLESEWATLKAHLLDSIQPLLGGNGVRRLGATRIIKDEL